MAFIKNKHVPFVLKMLPYDVTIQTPTPVISAGSGADTYIVVRNIPSGAKTLILTMMALPTKETSGGIKYWYQLQINLSTLTAIGKYKDINNNYVSDTPAITCTEWADNGIKIQFTNGTYNRFKTACDFSPVFLI